MKDWVKLKEDDVDVSRRELLKKCIADFQRFQVEWQKTAIEIIRIDSEHKFSRKNYDGVAAGIIKNQKVEIFYSKEHGKKFQNILDWLSQLEMKILVHFPQPDEKVAQVIAHLSPKIQVVAKVQNFKSYEQIKTWLKSVSKAEIEM